MALPAEAAQRAATEAKEEKEEAKQAKQDKQEKQDKMPAREPIRMRRAKAWSASVSAALPCMTAPVGAVAPVATAWRLPSRRPFVAIARQHVDAARRENRSR